MSQTIEMPKALPKAQVISRTTATEELLTYGVKVFTHLAVLSNGSKVQFSIATLLDADGETIDKANAAAANVVEATLKQVAE